MEQVTVFRDAATRRTDGDPEKEETRIAALKRIMEEEDRQSQELYAKIEMLKERRRRHRGPVTD
jgi:F0F1-type ATP synthase epsilon subunit